MFHTSLLACFPDNMACSLQYQKTDGQWEKAYYQMRQNLRQPTEHCARVGYERAMMIYSMVMQIEYINRPAWMNEIVSASSLRIKEVSFDPLTRVIAVRNLNVIQARQCPTLRSKDAIREELLAAGLRIANSFPANEEKRRFRCDLCVLNHHTNTYVPECTPNLSQPDPVDGSTDCQDCQVLNRPCTRTFAPKLVGAAADAALGRPPLSNGSFPIPPLELLRFGGDDDESDDEVDELRQARRAAEAAQGEEGEPVYDEDAGPE